VIGHEANLAWALALAAKPHLDIVERDDIFVAIGAGETFAVVRALIKWVAINRIPVEPDLVRQCISWLDAYVGHEDERYLRRLIENFAIPTDSYDPGTGRGQFGRGSADPGAGRIRSNTVRNGGHVARPRRVTAYAVSTALGSESGSTLTPTVVDRPIGSSPTP
jgi:hypothetical protein